MRKRPGDGEIEKSVTDKFELDEVADAVHAYTHYSLKELRTKNRNAKINRARQYFMYIAYVYTRCPYTEVGNYVNRNHATVLYACKKYGIGYVPDAEQNDIDNILAILQKGKTYPTQEMNEELGKAYHYSTKSMDFQLGIEKLKK